MEERLDPAFIARAAAVIADTKLGISGSNIIDISTAFAADHGVDIPHCAYPFEAGSKRIALRENLEAFPPHVQFELLRSLFDHPQLLDRNPDGSRKLKVQLLTRYNHLAAHPERSDINEELVEETRHWLGSYPEVRELYETAIEKYRTGAFERNVLDNLRLALEILLKAILENQKSLENQTPLLGAFVKRRGDLPSSATCLLS